MNAATACRAYVEAHDEYKRLTSEIGSALLCCPRSTYDPETESGIPSHLSGAFRSGMSGEKLNEFIGRCTACVQAYALVLKRKEARKRFGAAKRAVTLAGKLVIQKGEQS